MELPPEHSKGKEGKVCRLLKSLYGLKQASRQWYAKFSEFILKQGFTQYKANYSLFIKSQGKSFTTLLIYVDDIIVAKNDKRIIDELKDRMNSEFQIKDLGIIKYVLGIKVARSKKGIHICQRKYTLDLLKNSVMLGRRTSILPLDQNVKLSRDQSELITYPKLYKRLINKLMHLTLTKPYLTYLVLSQFIEDP